jgi:pimeloyl-ACP methyl ester carboxylesterase
MHIAVPYQLLVGLLQICKRAPRRTPELRLTYLLSSILHPHCWPLSRATACAILLASLTFPHSSRCGGVTVITHGYNANIYGWVTGMADQIPGYSTFPGASFTTYTMVLSNNAGTYYITTTRTNGSPPSATDSGEIIVKLDWSNLDDGSTYSTFDVARQAAWAFQQTNLITELGGHALAELPLHLIGHSRGGSLVTELARELGTNGLWVDHLTTLDPYPLNNDGNFDFPLSAVDAPAKNTYLNVMFADNYWQDLGAGVFFGDPDGEPVFGAFVRQLTSLSGGYNNDHSNVHLWYHGTIEWITPASDTEATITSTERANWWTAYERGGTNAGFEYSLIGTSNRLSTAQPVGPGYLVIRDGFNQWWDLGAGTSSNRVGLTTNNGNWPNVIRFNRTDTNQIVQGQSVNVKLFYQWARPAASNATFSIYLDNDTNPFNGNQKLLSQSSLPATGAAAVGSTVLSVPLSATNASPGWHSLLATISGAGQTRYLYAPEKVQVLSSSQRPSLDIVELNPSQFQIGVNGAAGQVIIVQTSPDFVNWQPLATNTLSTNRWLYTNTVPASAPFRFYRARTGP